MNNFEKCMIPKKEQSSIKGGFMQYVAGMLIWGLWEIFDDPEGFKKGFKDGRGC